MCRVATNLPLLLEIIYDMVNCDSTSVAIDVMPKLLSLFLFVCFGNIPFLCSVAFLLFFSKASFLVLNLYCSANACPIFLKFCTNGLWGMFHLLIDHFLKILSVKNFRVRSVHKT